MSVYRLNPSEPPPKRSPWLITGILLALVLLLLAGGGFFWLGRYGVALAPTPTATATPAAPPTATPDFRATLIREDQATQIAYLATVTRQTPVNVHLPWAPVGSVETPTPSHYVVLPIVSGGGPSTPTGTVSVPANPGDIAEGATPTVTVHIPIVVDPPSPLETPTPTVENILPTDTPTPTETLILTDTPTPTETPTATPTVIMVNSLRAVVRPTLTVVFVRGAPSNAVTPVSSMAAGTAIQLLRRDASGEWVYFCCPANDGSRWMRQVYAPPTGNPTVTTLPPSATPDDVRWLGVEPWPVGVPQTPTATPIPAEDFPYFRHDRANTGRVPAAVNGFFNPYWLQPAVAGQPFTSGVVVVGQYVIVASAENQIYSFNRTGSNQEWKYTVGQPVRQPLMVQENTLYFADESGRAFALRDNGTPLWQVALAVADGVGQAPPMSGFVGAGARLFIIVNNSGNYRVLQLDRSNGAVLRNYNLGNSFPQPLAIGNQLLYVAAGARLYALDVEDFETVWVRDLTPITAPPVYALNGPVALAELYVAGDGGRIYVLDANLGTDLRSYDGGNFPVSGLALGDTAIYAYGNGFVRAYDRRNNSLIWPASNVLNVGGDVRSLFVTADQLVFVTGGGSIQFLTQSGNGPLLGPSLPTTVASAPALSGSVLFVPGNDARLYAFSQ